MGNFGDPSLIRSLPGVALVGDPGSDPQSDCSVLAMGESGLKGGRTSPGIVMRRLRDFCTRCGGIVGARGGFKVNRCVDVPSSKFLPLRDRFTSGEAGAGVGSRDGGFGRAWSFLRILLKRL